jgi:hypothetical protein
MLTMPQWIDSRRVDHVNIPILNLNPRYRAFNPGQRPDLKMFDVLVQSFTTAQTEVDKVNALADIIDLSTAFLTNNPSENRYLQPVQALQNSAVQDLNAKFSLRANAMKQDIVAAANGQALAAKQINLNVYYLVPVGSNPALGPVDTTINQHIATANGSPAFQSASLTVNRVNAVATLISQDPKGRSIILTSPPAPVNLAGKLQDATQGGASLIDALAAIPGTGVDVVYLDDYDADDIQGRTLRTGQDYYGSTPVRPIVTIRLTPAVGGAATFTTTLLHELGHAISGNGEHITDANNLMSAGSARNGFNQLKLGQIAWYRNNPHVV